MGGIGTYCQTLLNSSLTEHVELRFVQTSSQRRALLASGSATWVNLVEALQDCWRFLRVCLAHRPDIAHICTAQGLSFLKNSLFVLLARTSGCRVLLHPHCGFTYLYRGNRYWQWFCLRVFRLAREMLVLSREWLVLPRISPGTMVHYLPNAIDIGPYDQISRRRPRASDRPVHILYMGYLGEEKGTYDLLEAFRIMNVGERDLVLDLVGDFLTGRDEERLRQLTAGLSGPGKTCRLVPPVFGEEKIDRFEEADIFAFPSHHEGMPMAILEAMASGLPIVATAVGGIPDLISDGINGFLMEPKVPQALARALEKLSQDPDLCFEFGSRNRMASQDRSILPYTRTLLLIYADLLSRGRGPRREDSGPSGIQARG
jgi:glycosyltransferase involved in cell wall biosynthesis